jgi:hypothetical protein
MPNIQFGAGVLIGKTTTGTPVQFGTLQEVSLSFESSMKELHGQYQFPIAIGRGVAKVSGNAKFADINSRVLGELYFNETPVTGQTLLSLNEAHTVPGSVAYTVTTTEAAHFVDDYGVIYTTTGLPLQKVSSLTAAGQYTVDTATGIYTFYSGDASAAVKISYTYTTTGGYTITMTNQLLGVAPVFQVILHRNYNSKIYSITLYNAVSTKLTVPTKLEDFSIAEFDFGAFVNSAGNLGKMSFPE